MTDYYAPPTLSQILCCSRNLLVNIVYSMPSSSRECCGQIHGIVKGMIRSRDNSKCRVGGRALDCVLLEVTVNTVVESVAAVVVAAANIFKE